MKKVISIILVIIWMEIIFCFSNQNADDSAKISDGFITTIINFFVDDDMSIDEKELLLEKCSFYVRKLAHFTLYFVLGILVLNLLYQYNLRNKELIGIVICIIYSCSDEFHQLFIPGRSGELRDVFIDSIGSLSGIFFYKFVKKMYSFRKNQIIK